MPPKIRKARLVRVDLPCQIPKYDIKLLNINQNLYCHRKGKQRKLGSKDICAELHLTL